MMNLRDAAYNVVHDYPGGAASLAPRMGKNPITLCHEVAGHGTAKFSLVDAEKATQLSGDMRILQTFASNCGQMVLPLPAVEDLPFDDCMARLAESSREFASLCGEVAQDLSDGVISDNELKRIDRATGMLISRVHALRESLARRNELGKPQGERKA